MAKIMVPITKGKAGIEVDTDGLPDDVYREILLQGLKTLMNRGTTKITKETYPVEAELKAAAMAKAEEQHENIKAGKIKLTGQKAAKGTSGAVKTEAMRLARALVKDEMKKAGIKISHVEASEITKAAKEVLDGDAGQAIIDQATANLAERAKAPITIDVSKIAISSKKVAAAEAKKAKDKADKPLSATQAGKVATRVKGKGKGQQATA